MRYERYSTAKTFVAEVEPELGRDEAANSLMLGLSRNLGAVAGSGDRGAFMASYRDADDLLAAFLTPPRPLVLASSPADRGELAELVANTLSDEGWAVSGVTARPRLAEAFAKEWAARTGARAAVGMRQRIYRLTAVAGVARAPGRLRRAVDSDSELIGRWMAAFNVDIGDEADPDRALAHARPRIERGEFYLWEDTEPRSMAARSRPTRSSITVNAVYTPPEWRGRGYATAAVATLSSELLGEGYAMCVLYTDLANPTSNRIYRRIGYEAVCDSLHLRFA